LALFLQQGLGRSAVYSGLLPIAWVAAFGGVSPLLGSLGPRWRRLVGPAGGTAMAAAFAGSALARDRTGWLILLLAVGGAGYGAAVTGTLSHLTESVPTRYAPDVSGLFNTVLQVGGTMGVAVFGTAYLDLVRAMSAARAFSIVSITLACLSLASAALIAGAESPRRRK
jgi:hypothetical protein